MTQNLRLQLTFDSSTS